MRTPGSDAATTWPAIRRAAIDLISTHGYSEMNIRALADSVGIKPGSLYYYFGNKEDLLYGIIVDLLDEIHADLQKAIDDAPNDPITRLSVYVGTIVWWHVNRQAETRIARMDIRSLSADRFADCVERRDKFDQQLDEIIDHGCMEGVFDVPYPHVTRIAIMSMLTEISSWYRAHGDYGADELTEIFAQITLKMCAAQTPGDQREPSARSVSGRRDGRRG